MKKIISIFLCVVILAAGGVFAVYGYRELNVRKIEATVYPVGGSEKVRIPYICKTPAFNHNDLEKVVGCSDYMFIGTFEEFSGVRYEDVGYGKDGKLYGSPYTECKVNVVQNIKGDLQQYISMSVDTICSYGDGHYLILTYTRENGEICTSTKNIISLGKLSEKTLRQYKEGNYSETAEKYYKAFLNQDTSFTDKKCNYDLKP